MTERRVERGRVGTLYDEATRREALEVLSAGASLSEVSAAVGCSVETLRRWARQAAGDPDGAIAPRSPQARRFLALREAARAEYRGETPATPPPAVEAPPPPEEPPPLEAPAEDGDELGALRAMRRDMLRMASEAERAGNFTAAQRARRDAASLAPVIARVDRARRDTADVVAMSLPEIEETMAGVRDRVAALLDRPPTCAHCGRALSVSYGGRKLEGDA